MHKNKNMKTLFTEEQQRKSDFILDCEYSQLSSLAHSEIQDLGCAWCYYSGKVEGNTYTYVETESLIKDGITSEKRYEDAKMLKNLYNTFISELEYITKKGEKEKIDEATLFRLHKQITAELIGSESSGVLRSRPVAITGTSYRPPKTTIEIRQSLSEIFYLQDLYENPLERAVFLHCNLARLQPFIDGNKRTSRMVESVVMMNENIIPVYSTQDADINEYRRSLVEFYETEDYTSYADYFLGRQLSRLQDMGIDYEEERSRGRVR